MPGTRPASSAQVRYIPSRHNASKAVLSGHTGDLGGHIMESITIDFDKMPEKEKRVLGDTLYAACKAFYENPDNLARYNEWKAKREAAK